MRKVKVKANKAFLIKTKHRIIVSYGGAGSGKSHHWIRHELLKVMSKPGYNVLALRKTAASIATSVFPLLIKIINEYELNDRVRINKSEHYVECKENGNVFFTGGMNSVEEREKVKSTTCKSGNVECIIMEEATQFNVDDFRQANLRLRGKSGHKKRIYLLCNPVSIDHWIKKEFQIEIKSGKAISKNDRAFVQRTTYHDNKFIDEEYKQELEALKESDPYFYQVYCLGEWGAIAANNVIIPYPTIWKARENKVDSVGQFDIGVDAARYGDNDAAMYIKKGKKFLDTKIYPKSDGNDLADGVQFLIDQYRKDDSLMVHVKIDITGVGSSCYDSLKKRKLKNVKLYAINFGGKIEVKNKDQYANVATEMYFEARDAIPTMELLPDDETCFTELSRREYRVDSNSRYIAVDKTVQKTNTGLGFDRSDAFVLTCYVPYMPPELKAWSISQ